jgi:hypothetical protein
MPRYAWFVLSNVFIALRINLRRRVAPAHAATLHACRAAGPCDGYLTLPLPDPGARSTRKPPDWERLVADAALLQTKLPGAVLVGGTAAAVHARGSRLSRGRVGASEEI